MRYEYDAKKKLLEFKSDKYLYFYKDEKGHAMDLIN